MVGCLATAGLIYVDVSVIKQRIAQHDVFISKADKLINEIKIEQLKLYYRIDSGEYLNHYFNNLNYNINNRG